LFITGRLLPERVAVLEEIDKPNYMTLDNKRLYITQGASIFIYSLKDYKLETKFGKRGEGPREFKIVNTEPLHIDVQSEHILVDSFRKISFYTKAGTFVSEHKTKYTVPTYMRSLRGKYAALDYISTSSEKKKRVLAVNILDGNFNKIREISRAEENYLTLIRGVYDFKVYDDLVFISYPEGEFVIDCFDEKGALKFTIKNENFKRRRVTEKEKQDTLKRFSRNLGRDYSIDRLKKIFEFSKYWPAVSNFFVDNDIVYVVNNNRRKGKRLLFLYDISGKFMREVILPALATGNYTIKNGQLYELFEDEEAEEWQLHVSKIK
jgi:hypothetical protein